MGRNKSGPWSHSSATVAARCSRHALSRARAMDAVTEEARKLDEEDEEGIIALCCVLIVLIVVGLAHASRENIGRLGRVAGTAARYGSTPGWTRDQPRWPDRSGARKWLLDWKSSIWWETIKRLTADETGHPQLLEQFKSKTRQIEDASLENLCRASP